MKTCHKVGVIALFTFIFLLSLFFNVEITEVIPQNLVTFFSVVFGFYMTSIAILFRTSYIRALSERVDNKKQQLLIYRLKSYLLTSGNWSVFSIVSVILFTLFATKSSSGVLVLEFQSRALPYMTWTLDPSFLSPFVTSAILGIASVNVFFMLLLLRTVVYALIEEATLQ